VTPLAVAASVRPGPTTTPARPVVIAAHGSRDPRSAAVLREVAAAVGLGWPAPVTVGFLDFNAPTLAGALREAVADPIVVPALLTRAYHGRVDLPEVLASVGRPATVTEVRGPAAPGEEPDPRLLSALDRRLSELECAYDGVVLIAAGTSHPDARSTVEAVAAALGRRINAPCAVGYASAAAPAPAEAVARLRAAGAGRVVAASYFLAPGRLYDAAAASAASAGTLATAAPLATAPDLIDLILARCAAIMNYRS